RIVVQILSEEELSILQDGVFFRESNCLPEKSEDICILLNQAPIEPADLVVLTIGIVVSPLRPAEFIAAKHHGSAHREKQRTSVVLRQLFSQPDDSHIIRVAFGATVPGIIVVGAVEIMLEIGIVVFLVRRDQVIQSEPVVAGDEVDAVISRPAVVTEEVGRSGQPSANVRQLPGIAFAELPEAIAKPAVPFRPVHWKVTDLIGSKV